jgi:hypothetical protein
LDTHGSQGDDQQYNSRDDKHGPPDVDAESEGVKPPVDKEIHNRQGD